LEYAWRKAIKTIMTGLLVPVENPSISAHKPIQCNIRERRTMTQPMRLFVGPMMLIAGGIAALGLWMRCHAVEARLKVKKPLHFSVCS